MPKYLQEEVGRQGFKPVSKPRVLDLQIQDGEPLRFRATFEVLPEFEVSGYEELRTEHQEASVTDEEVEKGLEQLRDRQATYEAVEGRSLEDGDYAQIGFTGNPKPAALEVVENSKPVEVEDVMFEVGGENSIKEFSENLRGAAPGEQRSFEVNYPEDFADGRLAGRTFQYVVTVKGVKRKLSPELNDDFAKQLGEFENLEALKQQLRDRIKAEKDHATEQEAKNKLLEKLMERHEFPVPETLVEHQVDVRLERGLRALVAKGMRREDLAKMDFAQLRAGQREAALKEVKVSLILDRIAERESIEVAQEDVDREVEALARQAQQPVDEVRERLTQEGVVDRIRGRLRNEKTLDYLYRKPA